MENIGKALIEFRRKKQGIEYDLGAGLISEQTAYYDLIEYMLGLNFDAYFALYIFELSEESELLNYVNYDKELELKKLSLEEIKKRYFNELIKQENIENVYLLAKLLDEFKIPGNEEQKELIENYKKQRIEILEKIQKKIVENNDPRYIFGLAASIDRLNLEELETAIENSNFSQIFKIAYFLFLSKDLKKRKKAIKNLNKYNVQNFIINNLESMVQDHILPQKKFDKYMDKLESINLKISKFHKK